MGRLTRCRSIAMFTVLGVALWLVPTAVHGQLPGEQPGQPTAEPETPATDESPYEPTAPEPPAPAPSASAPHAETTPATPGETTLMACVGAFGAAQKLRRAGQLVESRAQVTRCAQPRCPVVLSSRCASWHRELADAIPTIAVAAKDPAGRDTLAVGVNADGRQVVAALAGRAIPLNPGMHVLRFEHPGSPVVRRLIVLTEGEKNRRVEISFSRAPAGWHAPIAPPPDAERAGRGHEPIWPLVIGGFGLAAAGLTVGTITGLVALSEHDALVEACPDGVCPDKLRDDYRQATTLAHVSTLSFIAAGVGTAVGLVSLSAGTGTEAPATSDRSAVSVRPAIGLGAAALTGTFP